MKEWASDHPLTENRVLALSASTAAASAAFSSQCAAAKKTFAQSIFGF